MLVLWLVRAAGSEIDVDALATAPVTRSWPPSVLRPSPHSSALPIAMLSSRSRRLGARLAEGAAYVGHALPGIVVALALVFLTLRAVPRALPDARGSCSRSRSSSCLRHSAHSGRRSCR